MARRRRRSARRVISVERVKKEAPARKRVNCLRERGAKRVGGVVGGGVGWGSVALGVEGGGVGVVMAGGVAPWRSAMPLWSGERRMGIEANGTEMFVVSLGSCQSFCLRISDVLDGTKPLQGQLRYTFSGKRWRLSPFGLAALLTM